jgi:hypothetical protein
MYRESQIIVKVADCGGGAVEAGGINDGEDSCMKSGRDAVSDETVGGTERFRAR